MYLLVFVFLVVAMLGIYTQVFAVQTARMFANQTTVAQMMELWQAGAVTLAEANKGSYGAIGKAGCGLTPNTATPPLPKPAACASGVVTAASGVMPGGYNFAAYSWYSAVYQPGGAGIGPLYVVTWAPPPASGVASDPIATPSVGISESDLFHQLGNIAAPLTSYGTVQTQLLVTSVPSSTPGKPVEYPLPIPVAVPNGSVAVISQL